MKTGIELIAIERKEQIEKHGRSIEKDKLENDKGQLGAGASLLAIDFPLGCLETEDVIENHKPDGWSQEIWEKMCNKSYKERLIIAGALIAAEIDRLNDYKEVPQNPYACFGRKPHIMDFTSTDEFTKRLADFNQWELEH